MSPEVFILNKHITKLFPFILEISDVEFVPLKRGNTYTLYLDIYVSPSHFCELLDERISKKIKSFVSPKVVSISKSLFPEWNSESVELRFFPSVPEKTTILEYLP